MSENDLRQEMDLWECELMEQKMKQLQAERDEAVAAEAVKDQTILELEDKIRDLKRECDAAVNRIKKQKYKHSGKLYAILSAVLAAALLAWAGLKTRTLSVLVGEPVIILCAVAAGFLVGWILDRELDNLELSRKAAQKRKAMEHKGE